MIKITPCYLLLGTNLGDKNHNLQTAKTSIEEKLGTIEITSSVYLSEAWGDTNQDSFLNQVVKLNVPFSAREVLETCLQIERQMGRVREKKWGSRLIDIDILYFGDLVNEESDLVIPHPEIQNRRFTLVPLVELDANFVHPKLGRTNAEMLQNCKDELRVEPVTNQISYQVS